ncbi:MAG: ABC transporter permease [Planctomycetota bacterium]|nr:ABC transporter permease [Planctomycetota bacterium]
MSLKKFSWRSMWRRPGRTILTVASIVIGVAAVVSVTITTTTTRNAYKLMASLVSGKADLVVEGEAETPFASSLLEQVTAVPGVKAAVPVFSQLSVMSAKDERIKLQLLGIDIARDSAVRDYIIKAGRPLEGGKELLLDETFARRLKLQVGDEVKLATRLGQKSIRVVGFLQLRGASALQHAGLVLLPIETAQTWFKNKGRLSSIQIVVDQDIEPETVRERIAALLPEGVRARPPVVRTQGMQEMLFSSEKGLQMTTSCTLLLAAFIILNTFMMNVSERRRQLSILRAIGATRRQITWSVLREAVLLGIVGTAIGIVLGLLAAFLLNRSLSNLLEVPLPAMQLNALPFVLAAAFGLGMSLLGSFFPARSAGQVSPLEGMDRVSKTDLTGVPKIYIEIGAILALGAATMIVLSIRGFLPMDVAIGAGAVLLIGIVLLLPLILDPLCRFFAFCVSPLSRVESGLALRQVLRHHARSTLTVGVLFVAGAGGVGMSYSILDNVRDVQLWYRRAVVGDFFVRAMLPDNGTGKAAPLPDELCEALRKVPRLTALEGNSWVQASVGEITPLVVAKEVPEEPLFDLVQGDARLVRRQMLDGEVVIGSVLAQRLSLGAGDNLELDTQQGKRKFPICAVTNDYLFGGLTVYMSRDVAVRTLGVEGFAVFVIRAKPEDLATVRDELQSLCDQYGVLLHSNADITGVIDRMVTGIEGSLWGLVVLVFVVASFGVVNTLTMNVLEQTRELGVLRIVAMTRGQVRRTILTQALIMGAVGFTPSVLGGVAYAYVINLAIPAALGHPVEFGFHPWLVLGTLVSALTVTGMAAWFPAQRAANLDVCSALHYE